MMHAISDYCQPHPSSIPSERRRVRRCGFTLIELLVVIAIIALLVSILLPSLQQAKDLAKRVECMSLLRTLGTGFNFYYEDWGQYPDYVNSGGWALGDDPKAWYNVFDAYEMPYISVIYEDPYGDPRWHSPPGGIQCPSFDYDSGAGWGEYTYGYSTTFYHPINAADIRKEPPATATVVADCDSPMMGPEELDIRYGGETDLSPYRHVGETGVFMFSDSHSETRTYDQVPYESRDSFWWGDAG